MSKRSKHWASAVLLLIIIIVALLLKRSPSVDLKEVRKPDEAAVVGIVARQAPRRTVTTAPPAKTPAAETHPAAAEATPSPSPATTSGFVTPMIEPGPGVLIIRGRVLKEKSTPVPGASVELAKQENESLTGYGGAGEPVYATNRQIAGTVSDSAGRYEMSTSDTLPLILSASLGEELAGGINLWANEASLSRGPNGSLILTKDIVLEAVSFATGRVIDENKTPLAGAIVTRADHSLVTGADGAFRIGGTKNRGSYVDARKEGYGANRVSVPADGALFDITLTSAGSVVSGRTVDANDPEKAIPGASVTLAHAQPVNYTNENPLTFKMLSDGTGAFRFEHIPAGEYYIAAQTETLRYLSHEGRYGERFVLGENQKRDEFILPMRRGFVLKGQVVDSVSAAPVPGATVFDRGAFYRSQAQTTITDASGRFRFENVFGQRASGGKLQMNPFAEARGYVMLESQQLEQKFSPADTEVEVTIKLTPQTNVTGVARDPQGRPVNGVAVRSSAEISGGARTFTISDSNGRFSLLMPVGPEQQVLGKHPDFADSYTATFEVAPSATGAKPKEIELLMDPGGTVLARAVTDKGARIAGAEIGIMVRTRGKAGWGSANRWEKQEAGESGEVRFLHVPSAGSVIDDRLVSQSPDFFASAEDYYPPDEVTNVQLKAGEAKTIEFVMTAKEKGHFLSGTVLTAPGQPIEHVRIDANQGAYYVNTVTDVAGKFRFDDVKTGEYRITVRHPDFRFEDVKGESDKDYEIRALDLITYVGVVVEQATGNPVQGLTVEAADPPDSPRYYGIVIDPISKGSFRGRLKRGEAPPHVKISAAGFVTIDVTFAPAPSGENDTIQTFELRRSPMP
ncbi:hypothetical protein BH09SUM1_BH09SUM1_16010 [soil metagenome]